MNIYRVVFRLVNGKTFTLIIQANDLKEAVLTAEKELHKTAEKAWPCIWKDGILIRDRSLSVFFP